MKDESSDFYVPCHGVFCQAFIFPHIYFNPIKLYDFVLNQIWVPISYSYILYIHVYTIQFNYDIAATNNPIRISNL